MEVRILGSKRLSVIKGNSAQDVRLIYEAGGKAGNGTLEDRRVLETFVDGRNDSELKLQREQLKLLSDSRIVNANESGHKVDMTCTFNSQR